MPQDTLSSSLDAMEKGTLYSSDEIFDDDGSLSSSPPTSLSTRVLWFDAPSKGLTVSGNSLQLSSRSEISKPFVNISEHNSILSKSGIVNRRCISYQRPHSVIQQPNNANHCPEFFDNRSSNSSFQQQNTSGFFGNRPESAIHYPISSIQHKSTVIHHGSIQFPKCSNNRTVNDIYSRSNKIQLPELDANCLQKNYYSRSSSIQHSATVIPHGLAQLPERSTNHTENNVYSRNSSVRHQATVIYNGSIELPERSTSRPDNAIYQADIPRNSTNRTEYSKYPAASIPNSSTNRTEYTNCYQASIRSSVPNCRKLANHQDVIPRSSNQHQEYPTNYLENGIYCPSVSNQRIDFTIPPQNISIRRPDSVIGSIQLPERLVKPPGHAVRRPDIFSQRSEGFINNSDIFTQRAECSIIQIT